MPQAGGRTKSFPKAVSSGASDLHGAWSRRRTALYFAWTDTVARYRRSVLGPLWLVLGTAVGVVGLGLVWSVLLEMPIQRFVPMLTVSLITWQFISGTITEASGVFQRNSGTLTSIYAPRFSFSSELLLRQLVTLGHNAIVIAVVWIVIPYHWSWTMLLALPALLLVVGNLLALAQVIGFVGARYRDVEPLVVAVMPMLFFLTPVLYESKQLGPLREVMLFNPLAHWISVVRDPMMGDVPSVLSYSVVISTGIVLWIFALWITGAKGARLPYWV
ncbi:ABC transporter permease [Mesorhizobium sp. B3-1-3]|uniref:ABC transporter permease n=1 Tax=unclassified Mesorhizobium TaxID=325217 RepID=UPI00112A4EDD|nr:MULTISPECIES: ABC transporter permease [unclassified Mesorhizobium]TPI60397.1 ABC transporter permease [Mesorhizobium sp. B3-1-8]TPI68883.1 ABC transporter permease [Mesorhizobium sp. B3-1-3]UCI25332.1 ABC transporter permease [Mesorhizobium sp. B2-8-5]